MTAVLERAPQGADAPVLRWRGLAQDVEASIRAAIAAGDLEVLGESLVDADVLARALAGAFQRAKSVDVELLASAESLLRAVCAAQGPLVSQALRTHESDVALAYGVGKAITAALSVGYARLFGKEP